MQKKEENAEKGVNMQEVMELPQDKKDHKYL